MKKKQTKKRRRCWFSRKITLQSWEGHTHTHTVESHISTSLIAKHRHYQPPVQMLLWQLPIFVPVAGSRQDVWRRQLTVNQYQVSAAILFVWSDSQHLPELLSCQLVPHKFRPAQEVKEHTNFSLFQQHPASHSYSTYCTFYTDTES